MPLLMMPLFMMGQNFLVDGDENFLTTGGDFIMKPATNVSLTNNSYVYFDNSNDSVTTNLSTPYNIGSGSQTYCWWMRADEIFLNYLVVKGTSSDGNQLQIYQKGDSTIRCNIAGSSNMALIGLGDVKFSDGWCFVSIIVTPTSLKYYLNGLLQNSISTSINNQSNTYNLVFGMQTGSSTFVYFGGMDEIGIWNIELTQSEIQSAMGSLEHPGKYDEIQSTNLTGWWRFEEGTGSTSNNEVQTTDATLVGASFITY